MGTIASQELVKSVVQFYIKKIVKLDGETFVMHNPIDISGIRYYDYVNNSQV